MWVESHAQTAAQLFKSSDVRVTWLGVDFSNVRLVGDFSQFHGAGWKSPNQLRDQYFPSWNWLIMREPRKYDVKGMMRKPDMAFDLDMIMERNAKAKLEDMETYTAPVYTKEQIEGFVADYKLKGKEGIGIVLIAECLNKMGEEAYYHFVAFNMKTKQVLVHERIRSEPMGFGLKNYWAGSIARAIKDIRNIYYPRWRDKYH